MSAAALIPVLFFGLRIDLAAPGAWRPLDIRFDGYQLTGYRLVSQSAVAGATLPVEITWRATDHRPGAQVYARLINRTTHGWATALAPTDLAGSGERSTKLDLLIPEDTPPGSYQIDVGFRTDDEPLKRTELRLVDRFNGLGIGPITVRPADRAAGGAAGVSFDNHVHLIAHPIGVRRGNWRRPPPDWPVPLSSHSGRVQAGWLIHGDWHWQALTPNLRDYTISFRLVDGEGFVWASHDSQPLAGLYPTSYWRPGERVYDQQDIFVHPEVPPGRYDLELRVIDAGRPLPVRDPGGAPIGSALHLGSVDLEPPVAWRDPAGLTGDPGWVNQPLSDWLTLLTARLSRSEVRPGDPLAVETRWHAPRTGTRENVVRWELIDPAGQVWGTAQGPPTGQPAYPTSRWAAGTVVRGRHQLILDPHTPSGDLVLRLVALDTTTGELVGQMSLSTVKVLAHDRVFDAQFDHRVGASLGGSIELAGFDLPELPGRPDAPAPLTGALPPGRPLEVRLWWRGQQTVARSYTVFVQLLDRDGHLVSQSDALPASGARPTSSFVPGELVADDHLLAGSAALPPGRYTLIAGLYDPATGERLLAPDGKTFLELAEIEVVKPPIQPNRPHDPESEG